MLQTAAPPITDLRSAVELAVEAMESGRLDEAALRAQHLIAAWPEHGGAWQIAGIIAQRRRRIDEAVERLRQSIALDASQPAWHYNLAHSLHAAGRLSEASRHLRRTVRLDPGYLPALQLQALVLAEQGQLERAIIVLRQAAQLSPDDAIVLANLASLLQRRGELDEATEVAKRAAAADGVGHDGPPVLAELLHQRGDSDAARERLQPHMAKAHESDRLAVAIARLARGDHERHDALAAVEARLAAGPNDCFLRAELHFAAGRLLDRLARYDDAFTHYQQGNDALPTDFNRARHASLIDGLIDTFDPKAFTSLARSSVRDERPVFVIGMPRSGTSLVEQIIASHPRAVGAGELPDIDRLSTRVASLNESPHRYPASMRRWSQDVADTLARDYLAVLDALEPQGPTSGRRIVDKMPQNFLHLPLIALLFPGCRIVHCVRDARDTCLSCYFQNFADRIDWASSLEDLAFCHRQYERLMAHYLRLIDVPILHIEYETLAIDPRPQIRRLINFVGLPWDERCLRFHELDRPVATASYEQVRQPMYQSSIGRWRHYEQHLQPLLSGLRR